MSKKSREIDFNNFYEIIGTLNDNKNVLLAVEKRQGQAQQDSKRVIIKKIDLSNNYQQMKLFHDNILRKLYANNQPIILKPDYFCFHQGCLYISSKVHPMSLQTMIRAHRRQRGHISSQILWSFTCKMYDTINRMKQQSQLYHQNLKPSNIFFQYTQSQIKWSLSEAGLHSNYRNKYYSKISTQNISNNNSMKIQVAQLQFYSLAVMILEMATLSPIQKIDKFTRQKNGISKIEGIDEAMRNYGSSLIELVKQLLSPKENLKDYFYKFRQQQPRKLASQISIDDYYRQSIVFYEFCKNAQIIKFQETLKQTIQGQSLHFKQILDYIKKFDGNLQFFIDGFDQLETILSHLRLKKISISKLVTICIYYTQQSKFKYMDLFIKVIPTRDIIDAIIKEALQNNYGSCRKFFDAMHKSRDDFWRVEEIHQFFKSLGINIKLQSITQIIKQWTNDRMKDGIKFKDFYQVFKSAVNQSVLSQNHQQTKMSSTDKLSLQRELIRVLKEVQKKCGKPNLISFFRVHDNKQKWVVNSKIEKQIKHYVNINDNLFKNVCDQMWRRAGVPGQQGTKGLLRYVYLLKMIEFYDRTELFRLVLTEKINQSNKSAFFNEYAKDQKGWNLYSLIDFNHKQILEFDQTEIRLIFNELDKDRSGYITQAQLLYKLTGLRQFDQQLLISQIKDIQRSYRHHLLDLFIQVDENKDLLLDNPQELKQFFKELTLQIPDKHCEKIWFKFQRSQKFEYLLFLRFFYDLYDIFLRATKFLIQRYFKGDFDKIFQLGIKNGKKKWNRQSIVQVCDQLFHCFTENQIGQIWDNMDKAKDGSLTKKQVGQIFGYDAENDSVLQPNNLSKAINESPKKDKKLHLQQKQQNKKGNWKKEEQKKTMKDKIKEQIQKNQVLRILNDQKINVLIQLLYSKSQKVGWLNVPRFQDILIKMGIRASKNTIYRSIEKFIFKRDKQRQEKVNFIKILLFMNQSQNDSQAIKSNTILSLLKMKIYDSKISYEQMFKRCKVRDQMRITDFDRIFRDLLDVQVYFEDIQDVWRFLGDQSYLTPQDLQRILESPTKQQIMKKQYSFRPQSSNRQDYSESSKPPLNKNKNQQSPYKKFNSRNQSRRQSDDNRYQYQVQYKNNTNEKNDLSNINNNKKQRDLQYDRRRLNDPKFKEFQKQDIRSKFKQTQGYKNQQYDRRRSNDPKFKEFQKQDIRSKFKQTQGYKNQQYDRRRSNDPKFKEFQKQDIRSKFKQTQGYKNQQYDRRRSNDPKFKEFQKQDIRSKFKQTQGYKNQQYDRRRSNDPKFKEFQKQDIRSKFKQTQGYKNQQYDRRRSNDPKFKEFQKQDIRSKFKQTQQQKRNYNKWQSDQTNQRRQSKQNKNFNYQRNQQKQASSNKKINDDYGYQGKYHNRNQQQYYKKQEKQQDKYHRKKNEYQSNQNKKIIQNENIKLFQKRVNLKGIDKLNNLFLKSNVVDSIKFSKFIKDEYDFTIKQSNDITEQLSAYGKVKIQTIKNIIRKGSTKQEQINYDSRAYSSKKNIQKKKQTIKHPQTVQQKKIFDSRKSKLNIPLVKEHIKMLINYFCKKFQQNELEAYFFQNKNYISRDQFSRKCHGINSSIANTMIDKIFEYLKPKPDDTITILSFRIAFYLDQNLPLQEDYLPDQIQKQIKQFFQKADNDKSGTIQVGEIQKLLTSLGMNQTKKQIQSIFVKIDKNFDKKVSFKQFKIFLEENILPSVTFYQQDIQEFKHYLQINDLYNTGYLNVNCVAGILQKLGIKVNQSQMNILMKHFSNQNQQISIKKLLDAVNNPCQHQLKGKVKNILYRIKWKRKVSIRDIKKVFQNLSSCFLLSFTSESIKKDIIKYSSSLTPKLHQSGYFYQDFQYKNIKKVQKYQPNLIQQINNSDIIVQIKIQQACGLPIPQNQLKHKILRRHINVGFYDLSSESIKHAICSLQCQWDADVQDQWLLQKSSRSIFIKMSNQNFKKQQRLIILFEFIISIPQQNKLIEISCGSSSIGLKQLIAIQSRANKRIKIDGGIPTKSRQLDKNAITKRSGWKNLLNSNIESEIELQINSKSRFTEKLPLLAAIPSILIINRKIIHYVWCFRQFFAYNSLETNRVNPNYENHYKVKVFLITFDTPAIYSQLVKKWKDKIQVNIKGNKMVIEMMKVFLQQMYNVIYSKQFEYRQSQNVQNALPNKTLHQIRIKMVQDVLENIQYWLKYNPQRNYTRKKNYSNEFIPFQIKKKQLRKQDIDIAKAIIKFAVK